jgi:hypothetical protein
VRKSRAHVQIGWSELSRVCTSGTPVRNAAPVATRVVTCGRVQAYERSDGADVTRMLQRYPQRRAFSSTCAPMSDVRDVLRYQSSVPGPGTAPDHMAWPMNAMPPDGPDTVVTSPSNMLSLGQDPVGIGMFPPTQTLPLASSPGRGPTIADGPCESYGDGLFHNLQGYDRNDTSTHARPRKRGRNGSASGDDDKSLDTREKNRQAQSRFRQRQKVCACCRL